MGNRVRPRYAEVWAVGQGVTNEKGPEREPRSGPFRFRLRLQDQADFLVRSVRRSAMRADLPRRPRR